MANETVPARDKRCGQCGDQPDGRFMCESCIEKRVITGSIEHALMFGEDPKGRHWLDRRPDDPDQN